MRETVWEFLPEHKEAEEISKAFSLDKRVANILLNRGLNSKEKIRRFLNPSLDNLYEPFLLDGMEESVERILRAREKGEKIIIIGDYDVDGLSSSILLHKAFNLLNIDNTYYIPHRLNHGYGVKKEDINIVKESGANLVITVDNGITGFDFAEEIKRTSIDLIITDHHIPAEELPPALSIINPKLKNSNYPFKHLAGVGVAFKLVQALFKSSNMENLLPPFLKWAALGTIADVVPLIDENRIIVSNGIKEIENSSDPALNALMKVSGVSSRGLNTEDFLFRICPRINVAGRLEDPNMIMSLFLSDEQEAFKIAKELNKLNGKRQSIENKVLNEAKNLIQKRGFSEDPIIIIEKEGWHKGVIGIVASKLVEEYGRPVILIAIDENGKGHASGRSAGKISLIDKIRTLEENLKTEEGDLNFGGHAQAIGFTIDAHRIEGLRAAIRKSFNKEDTLIKKRFFVDGEIDLFNLNGNFFKSFNKLKPFGFGNTKPVFALLDANIKMKIRKDSKRVNLKISKNSSEIEAYLWKRPYIELDSNKKHIIFTVHTYLNKFVIEVLDLK